MQIGIGLGRGPDAAQAALEAARQAKQAVAKPDVALVFASTFLDQKAAHRALCAELDPNILIGCSSYAEISPAGVTQDSVAVLLLQLPGAKVSFAQTPVVSRPFEAGEDLASQLSLSGGATWPLGLMVTGISTGYENEILHALREKLGGMPVFGGVGCGKYNLGLSHPEFRKYFQYLGPELAPHGARIALLELPKKDAALAFGFGHGWQPVGPETTVTRAKGHHVYEVDGVPIIEFFRQFLGDGHKDDFFELMIQRYGFAMLLEGKFEGRSLLKLPVRLDPKHGSLEFWPAEDMQGRRVRLIQCSRQDMIEGARQAAVSCREALGGVPPALVLMVSCCTRKDILHSRVEKELAAVREVFGKDVPVFGYYSGGEIAPFLNRSPEITDPKLPFSGSYYHTTSVALLAIGSRGAAAFGGLTGPDRAAASSDAEVARLSQLLAKSEEVLDNTESFLSNLSRKSYRDGERLKHQADVIHRYTPHSVFSSISENVAKGVYEVGDAEFTGCFMFLDVKGFTSFSEDHPAAEVVKALNELFDPATRVIYENGGDVDKFIGDSIFAAFKTAEEALRCGRKLVTLFEERKRKGSPFSVRIGISSGRAVRANVGSRERREYTYIGDAVNLAQRLEGQCTPGRLLISEALFKKACVPFSEVERKEIAVKGKRKPVVCYECRP